MIGIEITFLRKIGREGTSPHFPIRSGGPNSRDVVPGGAGGAMAPPDFGRSLNTISSKRGRLCPPPNNTGTPGFSDLPTALNRQVVSAACHSLSKVSVKQVHL